MLRISLHYKNEPVQKLYDKNFQSLHLIMWKKMSDGLKLLLPTLTEAWHRSYAIHNNWLKISWQIARAVSPLKWFLVTWNFGRLPNVLDIQVMDGSSFGASAVCQFSFSFIVLDWGVTNKNNILSNAIESTLFCSSHSVMASWDKFTLVFLFFSESSISLQT